ncbi:hypothetical protein TNCV_1374291 [Trichonephila clavipes]|nr:hypothetical protein TNCV_1374291 [Trichonephila clavipes]
MNQSVREGDAPPFWKLRSTCVEFGQLKKPSVEETRRHFRKLRSACVEVGTIDKYSACVEAGTTISKYNLRRGVNSNNFNYITCEEVKSVESTFSWIHLLCKKANGAMKTSSVEFISRSPNPLPMKSLSVPSFLYVSDSPLVSMKKKKGTYRCGQRTVRLADCGSQSQAVFTRRRS